MVAKTGGRRSQLAKGAAASLLSSASKLALMFPLFKPFIPDSAKSKIDKFSKITNRVTLKKQTAPQ